VNLRDLFGLRPRVTLASLAKCCDRYGWHKYRLVDEPGEKEGALYTGWRSAPDDPGYALVIDPIVEKGCLCFRAPHLLYAPREETSTSRLLDLLVAIGHINYSIILGKFVYDPSDGEVRFSVDVPIDANRVTYEQFRHVLNVVTAMVEQNVPLLKGILEGSKTLDDVIKAHGPGLELFRRLFEGLATAKSPGGGRHPTDHPDRVLTEV